jgi:hypothetical protein
LHRCFFDAQNFQASGRVKPSTNGDTVAPPSVDKMFWIFAGTKMPSTATADGLDK